MADRPPISITPVVPTGLRRVQGVRCPDGATTWTEPAYPPSPRGEALRASRVALGLGLREAARGVGLAPVDLSRLESGTATTTREGWMRAQVRLVVMAAARREKPLPAETAAIVGAMDAWDRASPGSAAQAAEDRVIAVLARLDARGGAS